MGARRCGGWWWGEDRRHRARIQARISIRKATQYLVDAALMPRQTVNELPRLKIPDAHKGVT